MGVARLRGKLPGTEMDVRKNRRQSRGRGNVHRPDAEIGGSRSFGAVRRPPRHGRALAGRSADLEGGLLRNRALLRPVRQPPPRPPQGPSPGPEERAPPGLARERPGAAPSPADKPNPFASGSKIHREVHMTSGDSRDMLAILAGSGPDILTTRPVILGTHGMVTSGHYLASRIGLHILEEGGNAVDAGVAMGFALAVLEPYIYGIGRGGPPPPSLGA